jgi:XTP/dITP diphosphohydrolase
LSAPERRVVVATGNIGKLREIEALMTDTGMEFVAQSELGVSPADETGSTFVENALQKARHAAAVTGLPAIADDSGIVVDALGGRPGVHSARYAGACASDEDNVERLLEELDGIEDRAAHFHCAAVYVASADDPQPVIAEASWHGQITTERKGAGGFGYDPVFFVPECGCNSAELPADRKNALSHRGQAFRELAERLRAGLR